MATLTGTGVGDTLAGGDGDDLLQGLAGNDVLVGGAGNDSLNGGDGNDTVVFAGDFADYLVNYTSGVDSGSESYVIADGLAARDGTDQVQWVELFQFADGTRTAFEMRAKSGTAADDSLTGTSSSEGINGLAGNDTLAGGLGNDTLIGGAGDDLLNGGDGTDTASYSGSVAAVSVSLALVGGQSTGGAGVDTLLGIENLTGGSGNDTLAGNASANRIAGGSGDDSLHGVGNNDMLFGGVGNDSLDGGGVLAGGAGADLLTGGSGDDSIYANNVSPAFSSPYHGYIAAVFPLLDTGAERDTLVGGAGDDKLFAGYGDDVDGGTDASWGNFLYISFQGATSGVYADFRLLRTQPSITIGGGTITNIEEIGWLQGSEYDDFLAPIDSYYTSWEPVYGMGGNDHIVASYYTGTIDGGDGNDLLDATGGGYGHPAYGGGGDDTVLGGSSGERIEGGAGSDILSGNGGWDSIYGDEGDDVIDGGRSDDTLYGGAGNDTIYAAGENDYVYGDDGDDLIYGDYSPVSAGLSDMYPGDHLFGGAGNDTAVFSTNVADYTFHYDVDTRVLTVSDTVAQGDGVDTLTGIEFLQFADGTQTLSDAAGIGVLDGTAGADSLAGGGGVDAIYADSGDDTLAGAGGNDTLYGGAGTDTAVFAGNFADYSVAYLTATSTYVFVDSAEGRDGADRLQQVEFFQFADGTKSASQLHLTIDGTSGADLLGGVGGSDVINGHAGNDTLNGTGGADTLDGGAGFDSLRGESGDDSLVGGAGDDSIDGGSGNDTVVFGGSLSEFWVARNSADGMFLVTDRVDGRDGLDTLTNIEFIQFSDGVRAAADAVNHTVLFGTSGNDLQLGTSGADDINGLAGNDTLEGRAGADLLTGGTGNDSIYSNSVSPPFSRPYYDYIPAVFPLLDTGAERDTLVGGAGDDNLFAGYGDDVDGGTDMYWGNFLYISFQGATSGVYADFRLLRTQPSVTIGGGTITNIEEIGWLQGSEYDDFLATVDSYYSDFEPIYGMGGNDHIVASYYTGVVEGGEGNDLLDVTGAQYGFPVYGGAGDDTLLGSGRSALHGGEGNDEFHANDGRIYGEGGVDTAVFTGNFASYDIAYDSAYGMLGVGAAALYGVEKVQFADVTKTAAELVAGLPVVGLNITGTTGNDVLTGTIVQDTLFGGSGDDTLDGGEGNDLMDGQDGMDTATYASASAGITANLTTGVTSGAAGNDTLSRLENVIGSGSDDSITGNAGNNKLTGGGGDDTLDGRAGNDTLNGEAGSDTVTFANANGAVSVNLTSGTASGQGNDSLAGIENVTGSQYNDTLIGSAVANLLQGGQGGDMLQAGAGNDALEGGAGNDSLYGGAGDDELRGGSGSQDSLEGGDGSDTAMFSGVAAEYQVIYSYESGLLTVFDSVGSRDAAAVLVDVEYLEFADGAVAASVYMPAFVRGTGAADSLAGSSGVDVIEALAGNDVVDALEGDDTLVGGDGNDTLAGGEGNDRIYAGAGDDAIDGGEGADYTHYETAASAVSVDLEAGMATGGAGNDTIADVEFIAGSAFADTLAGDSGGNGLDGKGGADLIVGREGDDSLYGGDGDDTLRGGIGDDVIAGEGGTDTVDYAESQAAVSISLASGTAGGGEGNDTLGGVENVMGSAHDDSITGDFVANRLTGGGGDDTLNGGAGSDTSVFSGNFLDYVVSYDTGADAWVLLDTVADRDGNDRVSGVEMFQFADGMRSAAQLTPITGASGNDLLNGTSVAESLVGLAGNDTLNGAEGDDTLDGGAGNDRLDGGEGIDTATYVGASTAVKVSLALTSGQATLGEGTDTLTSIENLVGSDNNDSLTGSATDNRIEGGLGNDTLTGGLGADTLVGGNGNDVYFMDGADTVTELADGGTDTVNSSATYTLGETLENLTLTGKLLINGTGNALANVLTGNAVANTLGGEAGDDMLVGAAGNDTLQGGEGNDTLNGGSNLDQMLGGIGDDWYFVDNALDQAVEIGGEGADTVNALVSYVLGANLENLVLVTGGKAKAGTGNALDNRITGNVTGNTLAGAAGADTIDGGLGADILTGGADADVFRFSTALLKNLDKITDFNAVDDTIELDNAVFLALGEGALDVSAFQAAATSVAGSVGIRIIYNTGNGALLYDADGAGGVAAVQFATIVLTGLAGPVTAADFVVA